MTLDPFLALCERTELELIAKGNTPAMARGAVRMARRWAVDVGSRVSPELRQRVTYELLVDRLSRVERGWISKVNAAMAEGPATR